MVQLGTQFFSIIYVGKFFRTNVTRTQSEVKSTLESSRRQYYYLNVRITVIVVKRPVVVFVASTDLQQLSSFRTRIPLDSFKLESAYNKGSSNSLSPTN